MTGHPVAQYKKEFSLYTQGEIATLQVGKAKGQISCIGGLVTGLRTLTTRRGSRMGIVTLDDGSGRIDVTLFSQALEQYEHLLEKDKVFVFVDNLALMITTKRTKCPVKKY